MGSNASSNVAEQLLNPLDCPFCGRLWSTPRGGKERDPETGRDVSIRCRRLLAAYRSRRGQDRILARLRTPRSDPIDPTIAAHHGRIVKRVGTARLSSSVAEWRLIPLEPAELRPRLFSPCYLLLSPNYLPDQRELTPCYAPVRRATALFHQPSENKRSSADFQGPGPRWNRVKKRENREEQGG